MKRDETMTPAEREAYHSASEARIQTFSYQTPTGESPERVTLINSKLVKLMVRIIRESSEPQLRYHTNSETIWMVMRGRARFYGVGDKLLADLGPQQGILLPGGSRYRFERVGAGELELMQTIAVAADPNDEQL